VRITITRQWARRLCAAVLFPLAAWVSGPAHAEGQLPPECRRDLDAFNLFLNSNFLRTITRCLSEMMPPGDASVGEKLIEVEPVLVTSRDVARLIFGLYQKQRPIGIARVRARSSAGEIDRAACLVLLSGAEPTAFNQATTLPDGIRAAILATEDDDFFYAIMLALGAAVQKGYCDRGARLLFAGHSLGGMEAQNVAADLIRQNAGFTIGNVVTFGSPVTTALPTRLNVQRFTTIGDPIPYATHFTGTYRETPHFIVDDRDGPERTRAIEDAARDRRVALAWISNPTIAAASNAAVFVKWIGGALTAHMRYPHVRELQNYDSLGVPLKTGVGTSLVIDQQRTAGDRVYGLIHAFPAPRLRRAPR
jgi:Lipase (class 3)